MRPWLLVPSPETSITLRSVEKALSANIANEKSIAVPIAVRPRNDLGAAVSAAANAPASLLLRMTAQSTTTLSSPSPAHST